jgi:hypothetical protein
VFLNLAIDRANGFRAGAAIAAGLAAGLGILIRPARWCFFPSPLWLIASAGRRWQSPWS